MGKLRLKNAVLQKLGSLRAIERARKVAWNKHQQRGTENENHIPFAIRFHLNRWVRSSVAAGCG
jgi:hypothetical protein